MYTDIMELNIIKKLQRLDIDKQCRLLSKPFNSISFIIIVIFLYLFNVLNLNEILLLGLGSIIVSITKYIFKRRRPYNNTFFILNKSKRYNKTHSQNLWVKVRSDINFLMIKKLSLEWFNKKA